MFWVGYCSRMNRRVSFATRCYFEFQTVPLCIYVADQAGLTATAGHLMLLSSWPFSCNASRRKYCRSLLMILYFICYENTPYQCQYPCFGFHSSVSSILKATTNFHTRNPLNLDCKPHASTLLASWLMYWEGRYQYCGAGTEPRIPVCSVTWRSISRF